jgi:hypothetical protein
LLGCRRNHAASPQESGKIDATLLAFLQIIWMWHLARTATGNHRRGSSHHGRVMIGRSAVQPADHSVAARVHSPAEVGHPIRQTRHDRQRHRRRVPSHVEMSTFLAPNTGLCVRSSLAATSTKQAHLESARFRGVRSSFPTSFASHNDGRKVPHTARNKSLIGLSRGKCPSGEASTDRPLITKKPRSAHFHGIYHSVSYGGVYLTNTYGKRIENRGPIFERI